MMASLRHPSIVMYLGVCLDPPAVVTEYCARGASLTAWGGRGRARGRGAGPGVHGSRGAASTCQATCPRSPAVSDDSLTHHPPRPRPRAPQAR